ncbi:DUF3368 domain-containing protein [Aphanothece hegewaldii CCALA 016]|uniref:DUF3368 domain-containing protein n=1 Tax=Aphanothece hegewaldii CCALA 016 TaxID=2107694 RepID=A0A2T1LSW6_9CHRO|nr:DUF3368 domain-containing protein [Aphanothece hegewaldii]PSF33318.1 DUF3368 domain-containing protein [Aphanothece hegewaldii CCALA 016]
MIVVSDTSPICYLLLIGEIELLPKLYKQVLIPDIVRQELSNARSPDLVQQWINNPPEWLIIETVNLPINNDLELLDAGEQAAIILAEQQKASLIIIDDGLARKIACDQGLRVTGLLGVLDEATRQNLVDLPAAITLLRKTTFRVSSSIIDSLIVRHKKDFEK